VDILLELRNLLSGKTTYNPDDEPSSDDEIDPAPSKPTKAKKKTISRPKERLDTDEEQNPAPSKATKGKKKALKSNKELNADQEPDTAPSKVAKGKKKDLQLKPESHAKVPKKPRVPLVGGNTLSDGPEHERRSAMATSDSAPDYFSTGSEMGIWWNHSDGSFHDPA
jgi:hypothetical protein